MRRIHVGVFSYAVFFIMVVGGLIQTAQAAASWIVTVSPLTVIAGNNTSILIHNTGTETLTGIKFYVNGSIFHTLATISTGGTGSVLSSPLAIGTHQIYVQCNELGNSDIFTVTVNAANADWSGNIAPSSIQPGGKTTLTITNSGLVALTNVVITANGSGSFTPFSTVAQGGTESVDIPYANAGTYTIKVECDEMGAPLVFSVSVGAPAPDGDPTTDADVIGIQSAHMASAERFIRLQTGNIRNRLSRLRNGREVGRAADSFNFAFASPSRNGRNGGRRTDSVSSNSAVASFGSGTAAPGSGPRGEAISSRTWSVWGESMLSVGSDHDGGNNDHTTYGITLGFDRYFTQCFAAGIALGYAHDKTDVGKNGSESKGNAYTAALYGSYSLPQGFFIDGSAGYSRLDLDSTRRTDMGFVSGDRDGDQYFASLESGYDFRWCNVLISPYGRADASKSRLDKYAERGNARALRYDSSDINLFSLSAGLRGEYAFAMCWGALIPSAGVEYTHNFRDTVDQKMGYVTEGSLPYLLRNKGLAVNQFGASLGLEAAFHNGWTVGGDYQGIFASERRDHTFFLRVSRSW